MLDKPGNTQPREGRKGPPNLYWLLRSHRVFFLFVCFCLVSVSILHYFIATLHITNCPFLLCLLLISTEVHYPHFVTFLFIPLYLFHY